MTDTTTPQQPVYPLPTPADGDPRLTYGLLFDIAEVLQRNGFPQPAGNDWATPRLGQRRDNAQIRAARSRRAASLESCKAVPHRPNEPPVAFAGAATQGRR